MPEDKGFKRMLSVNRTSVEEEFQINQNDRVPEVPTGGARIKVCFAGACYTDAEVPDKRVKTPGVHDTSLFPGYEVSGVVDEVCNTIASSCGFTKGDRVIVYPDNQPITHTSFAEYVSVRNIENLLHVPENVTLEVAALLPCGALTAYAAVQRAQPFVRQKLDAGQEICHVMVVGAGGLGLWTLKMAEHVMKNSLNRNRVHLTVADTCVDKLMLAKEYGTADVIHWSDAIHEQYIVERTRDVCPGGIDVIIDFVSSPRSISRGLKLLKEEGVMLVGGNTKYDMTLSLHEFAKKNQSLLGVYTGSREQLLYLLDVFQQGLIVPPRYTVFPVDDANQVFAKLNQCQLHGRAVLKITDAPDSEHNNKPDSQPTTSKLDSYMSQKKADNQNTT